MGPHKCKRIDLPVFPDELINIPIHHPLRYHCKLSFIRRDTQKRQDIWMGKSAPCHNLLAESLHRSESTSQYIISARVRQLTLAILPMSLVE